ncbi:hypothetical protein QAD02_000409 [Eretmocerus hayati]|uniref:Uncharacterized protein n=1 Tax=Eretmocerus hayati TaxID=131215 RepID=A0ACC2NHV9_9HYME|nr:hypothetical protein QAD02_000409 [Eretmocerus hayati]
MKYVDEKRDKSIQHFYQVRDEYDLAHYVFLLKTTGILVGGFNGRGPDETGGYLLADYQNAKSPIQESEWFEMLTEDLKQQRIKYKTIDMQGKKPKGDGQFVHRNEEWREYQDFTKIPGLIWHHTDQQVSLRNSNETW